MLLVRNRDIDVAACFHLKASANIPVEVHAKPVLGQLNNLLFYGQGSLFSRDVSNGFVNGFLLKVKIAALAALIAGHRAFSILDIHLNLPHFSIAFRAVFHFASLLLYIDDIQSLVFQLAYYINLSIFNLLIALPHLNNAMPKIRKVYEENRICWLAYYKKLHGLKAPHF